MSEKCEVKKRVRSAKFPRTGSDSFLCRSQFSLCRGFSCFYCMFHVAMLLQWKLIWRRRFITRSIFELRKYQFPSQANRIFLETAFFVSFATITQELKIARGYRLYFF